MRPWPSTGSAVTWPVPMPSSRSARSTVTCFFAPATIRTGGPPCRPRSARSQSWRASTALRAAASAVTCAIWQPVTSAKDAPAGSPSSSLSQRPAVSSITVIAGVGRVRPAFWSQAVTSQSAASAAGSVPPMTKPK